MSSEGERPEDVMGERGLVEPVAVGPGDELNGSIPGDLATGPLGAERDAGPSAVPEAGVGPVEPTGVPIVDGADASLLALVDRLTALLEGSDLGELEVAAGATTIVLRAPTAIERRPGSEHTASGADGGPVPGQGVAADAAQGSTRAPLAPPVRPSVRAPLTGIYYSAPSPGAQAYVAVGDHVAVGQIIGLIEAMKLFNEIKSDLAGQVVRMCAENGALVKAKQPLIEVEPA